MKVAIFVIIAFSLLLMSCGRSTAKDENFRAYEDIIDNAKPIAFGEDNVVYVFYDQKGKAEFGDALRSIIERDINLVYKEKYFHMEVGDIADIANLSKYKNLIFVGDLSSNDKVSAYMRQSLAPEFIQRVQNSSGDMFIAKNHWVRDQIVLYLLGSDHEKLMHITQVQQHQIFELLLKRYTQRLAYQAYLTKVIPESFFDAYPFSLKIPENYRLFSNDKVGNFLSFIYRARMQNREIPDKYISVYYEDMELNKVDEAWMLATRKRIGEKYFEGDEFDPQSLRREKFSFAGFEGYRIIGAWKNMKHHIGGSFQAFGFWHESSNKAFFIDNSVYFPAGDKLPSMLEIYMISSTLKVK